MGLTFEPLGNKKIILDPLFEWTIVKNKKLTSFIHLINESLSVFLFLSRRRHAV